MNKALQTALTLLDEPLNKGCRISIYKDNDKLMLDLDTGAKSHCHLELQESGKIIAHRRYDRVDEVGDYQHLLDLVWSCGHGRSYFNYAWVGVLEANGFNSPVGIL